MPLNSLEFAQLQVAALFVHDADGRLLRINEPDAPAPAPRFFLSRTAAGNLWRTRHDLPPKLATELNRLAANEPIPTDLTQPPHYAAQYVELLRQHAPISATDAGPAYYLPELTPSRAAVTITPENVALLQAHFDWLLTTLDDYAPVSAVIVDGAAVTVCFSSRITPQVCEAGVYTVAEYRGRGYAAETVHGWAAAVRASGCQPLYDTSWTNTASQAVARKLGAVQYAVSYSLT